MPKRKRSALSPSPDASSNSSRAIATQRKLSTQRLQTAQKELSTALRLAASFERQKHGRRVKTAREQKDNNALARLAKEQGVLKQLDLDKRAAEHLKRTIARVKSLCNAEGLPKGWSAEDWKNDVKEKEDTLVLNVKARLFKVDAVRKVVDEVVDDLKEIVGVKAKIPAVAKDKGKKSRIEADEEGSEGRGEESDGDDMEGFGGFSARIAAPSSGEEDGSDDSLDNDDRLPSVVDSEREYSMDEEEESNNDDNSDDAISASGSDIAIPSTALAPSGDLDSNFSDPEEPSDNEASTAKAEARSKHKTESKLTKSTFLPSLSHAAYFSGSDSESASDLDAELGAPKKNRRGQRARQKIWEKKYGEKAKHMKKEDRNQGWDAKRGAVDASRDRRGGGGGGRERGRDGGSRGQGKFASGENAMPVKKKESKRDDVGTLHPSWAAAKAAKDKKIGVKPEGKKVVFD